MFCQAGFDQWLTTIMQHLSSLSKPQATVLAMWSFGMVLARSCALTAVSQLLAAGMRHKEQTVRQQLRGWYAPWSFRRITRLGWHPFLRINTGGSFRPAGATCWRPLMTFVPRPGTSWRGVGLAFTRNQVACTLLARWEDGYKDPWLILTDLPPEASDAGWYGLRAWIEQGFKITKRAGWQWHRTRMTDPARAARLWLAVAVATLWLLSVGGAAGGTVSPSQLPHVTGLCPGQPPARPGAPPPLGGGVRPGLVGLFVALLRQAPFPEGRFLPEPWPVVPPLIEEGWGLALALSAAA